MSFCPVASSDPVYPLWMSFWIVVPTYRRRPVQVLSSPVCSVSSLIGHIESPARLVGTANRSSCPTSRLGQTPIPSIHASRKSSKPFELPTQGSLDGWRDGLKDPCRASSYLTFGIGLAFAGPLLHLVGQDEGAIFYLAGESSTGKTLTELAAQSVIERAVRGELLTHDATQPRN